MAKPKLLTALPVEVVTGLCRYLNLEGAGVMNWKDLIAKVKGKLDQSKLFINLIVQK